MPNTVLFTSLTSLNPHNNHLKKERTGIISDTEMGKLRLEEILYLAQGNTSSKHRKILKPSHMEILK